MQIIPDNFLISRRIEKCFQNFIADIKRRSLAFLLPRVSPISSLAFYGERRALSIR